MLSRLAKPSLRALWWMRTLPVPHRVAIGLGTILGIAGLIGAIGTIRALPVLWQRRSRGRSGDLRGGPSG